MIFITGGARSGKSGLAEKIARGREAPVTYIATASPGDEEMRARIEAHQASRPQGWNTVEAREGLPAAVRSALAGGGTALVDCLTVYISNLLLSKVPVNADVDELVDICLYPERDHGLLIIVSNEVGMGIVPGNALARHFRDLAGSANQRLAAAAEEMFLCVSGIPLPIKQAPPTSNSAKTSRRKTDL
jgi:adenosylcobinamide kinase/adenosylcobinamide-phosphate guanylyltransferase